MKTKSCLRLLFTAAVSLLFPGAVFANQLITKPSPDPIGGVYRTAAKFLNSVDAGIVLDYEAELIRAANKDGSEFYFKVSEVLTEAENVEILSLEPAKVAPNDRSGFRTWRVTKQFAVSLPKDREKIFATMREGIENAQNAEKKCFVPRHGLRVTSKGKTVDLVFSFQCSRFMTYLGDNFVSEMQTNPRQELGFNNMLAQLGAQQ